MEGGYQCQTWSTKSLHTSLSRAPHGLSFGKAFVNYERNSHSISSSKQGKDIMSDSGSKVVVQHNFNGWLPCSCPISLSCRLINLSKQRWHHMEHYVQKEHADWELEDLIRLLATLKSFSKIQVKRGTANAGKYLVTSCQRAHNEIADCGLWKIISKTKLPPKIICFSLNAVYEACPTQDDLFWRNFHIVNSCYICQKETETVIYPALLSCNRSMEHVLFGLCWVMPYSIKEAF